MDKPIFHYDQISQVPSHTSKSSGCERPTALSETKTQPSSSPLTHDWKLNKNGHRLARGRVTLKLNLLSANHKAHIYFPLNKIQFLTHKNVPPF